ncbi:MAG: hypothetical protein ACXWJZ_09745 [Burkholderiaceae bacterium]
MSRVTFQPELSDEEEVLRVPPSRGKKGQVPSRVAAIEAKRAASRGRSVGMDLGEDVEMVQNPVYASLPERDAIFAVGRSGGNTTRPTNRTAGMSAAEKKRRANARTAARQLAPGYSAKRAAALRNREGGLEAFQAARRADLDARYAARGDLSDRDSRAFGRIKARNTGLGHVGAKDARAFRTLSKSNVRKVLQQYPGEETPSRVGERDPSVQFWPISNSTALALNRFAQANSRVDAATWASITTNGNPREYRLAKWINKNLDALYPGLRANGLAAQIINDYNVAAEAFFRNASPADMRKAADNLTAIASRQMGARSLKGLTFEGTALSGLKLSAVDTTALRSELNRMLRARKTHPKEVQNVLAALAYSLEVIAIAQSIRNERVSSLASRLSGPEGAELKAALKVSPMDIVHAEQRANEINRVQGKKLNVARKITKKTVTVPGSAF